MKHVLLVTLLALGIAACDDSPPPPRSDASGDARTDAAAADVMVLIDVAAPDTLSPDTAIEASADRADSAPDAATVDSGGSDLAAVDAGAADAGHDASDVAPDAGPTCGPGAPRDMLCATYCDGIGRFCTRGDTQYRNGDECRAACNGPAWTCGNPGETTGNSLFCRLAHMALAGVGAAATECPNAGPSSPTCR
jgi:hypothetical protein